MSTIPKIENWMKINLETIKKEIKEIINKQQMDIRATLDTHSAELAAVNIKLDSLAVQHQQQHVNFLNNKQCANSANTNNVSRKVNAESVSLNNVNNTLPPINQNAPGILWADVVSSPTLDEAFTLVKRHNKRPRLNVSLEVNNNGETTSNNNNENTANINTAKKQQKDIVKLKFDKNEQESTMFRVCIDSSDACKMKDPDIMLKKFARVLRIIVEMVWNVKTSKSEARHTRNAFAWMMSTGLKRGLVKGGIKRTEEKTQHKKRTGKKKTEQQLT
ncbi:hypothetical protein HELRODRAFT_178954 [Helobdella robusta]|uniref:Uncharacterized protein n=1 Tax=Helobdella robusta TaxID=6412 RepID=T1FDY4_HELRO|nr:hypothetical protein HELRODRAFT_178954 [Helobdella robusta]ESN95773.1 hypothetical protein HELRODRAFT_178954 [Helobdella robusta]